jgi:acetyl esterase/lipase
MPYGESPSQTIDFYKAKADRPTPLVVYIHGGAWTVGTKDDVPDLQQFLDAGISVASVEYRFIQDAAAAGIEPPVRAPLYDAARAIQLLRSRAVELNFDKRRIAYTGGSAGGCTSLWLALHNDLADPSSSDPIARESTKPALIAVTVAQTSLDPLQVQSWIPNWNYGGQAFGFRTEGRTRSEEFRMFLDAREKLLPLIREYSPYEHASADDPPIYLDYPDQKDPVVPGTNQTDATHSAILGLKMAERLTEVGVEVYLNYPGHPAAIGSAREFVIDHLTHPRHVSALTLRNAPGQQGEAAGCYSKKLLGFVGRRAGVRRLQDEFRASERRVYELMEVPRSSCRYKSRRNDTWLRERLLGLAREHLRCGCLRLHVLLGREQIALNHKKMQRVYRELRLMVKRTRRKRPAGVLWPRPLLTAPGEEWPVDFASVTASGRRLWVQSVIDSFTLSKASLLKRIPASPTRRVTRVLDRVITL